MKQKKKKIWKKAQQLVADPSFFSRFCRKLEEMGLVGEKRNALTILLACITKFQKRPVSVLVKGLSSTGKSNLLSLVCRLLPVDCLIRRASLTAKAPAHGQGTLAGKVLYIYEYLGGKEAMYLTRLQQSEGEIAHEYTTVSGRERTTEVAQREGSPVVLTSTTDKKVYADDDTRFLSLNADDSPELTREIVRRRFVQEPAQVTEPAEEVWREAIRLVTEKPPQFIYPKWLGSIAEQIPAENTRARRDANHFCSLLEAVALCRSYADGRRSKNRKSLEINFADYCVAFEILNEAFTSTYRGAHPQALRVAQSVAALYRENKSTLTAAELAEALGWERQLAYKWLAAAVKEKLVVLEPGTNEKNKKRYRPGRSPSTHFLPHPAGVGNQCVEPGKSLEFLDPLTGERKKLTAQSTVARLARGNRPNGNPNTQLVVKSTASTSQIASKTNNLGPLPAVNRRD